MASYTYRLPRRYRYRGRGTGGNAGPVIAMVVFAGLLAGGGAKAATSAAHHAAPRAAHQGDTRPAAHGSNEALANSMAASGYGWKGGQASCLDALWTEESAGTWSPTVTNPTSGAFGIPQALPASKMASAGADWQTSAATQVRWGLGYIHDRYGSPCAAWAFERSHVPNWY